MRKDLETLLRLGNIKEVQSHLEKIKLSRLKREDVLKIANVARRVGFHRMAFKILNPIVRPKSKFGIPATARELSEYGLCLFRLGVMDEAKRILNSPEAASCAERLLYLAFTHFGCWEFKKAEDLLSQYCSHKKIAEYDRLIGFTNLAIALNGLGQPKKAKEVLGPVIEYATKSNHQLILANALQTYAESLIDQRNLSEAEKVLQKITDVIGGSHYRYNLYIQKNFALIDLLKSKSNIISAAQKIAEVGKQAKIKRLPEVSRECDLLRAVYTKDEKLFRKVYHATPYPAYREDALRRWGSPISMNKDYLWNLNPGAPQISEKIFNIEEGIEEPTNKSVKRGTSAHRLLKALSSDLYKTFKSEALFSLVFPDEHLIFGTSVHRVHDTINRTRNWLASENINISIHEEYGEYSLMSDIQYHIRIALVQNPIQNVESEFITKLKQKMSSKSFTVNDVVERLEVSLATANRYLKKAIELGEIQRTGNGRATKYFILNAA